MLENVDLSSQLPKEEYKRLKWINQRHLHLLQRACWENNLASILVFEGWDASGKGTAINVLSERLEPRGFQLYAIREPRTYEGQMPWLWRFWKKIPNWGELAIFDRSWYGRVLVERVEKLVSTSVWKEAFSDINSFEQNLADDHYVIIKFFLHIDQATQKKRLKKMESDPLTSWQVEKEDWQRHRKYDQYRLAVEEMLERTGNEWAPWDIIESNDYRWSRAKMLATIIDRLTERLKLLGAEPPGSEELEALYTEKLDEQDDTAGEFETE